MTINDKLTQVIFKAVDEINENLSEDEKLQKSLETILYGKNSLLDSIGLVNLIVATEENIEDEFGRTLTIADEKAMSQKESPFKTIETLRNYIFSLLNEDKNG